MQAPTFGPRVKAARDRAHLDQRELAAASGVSQSALSRIENGSKTPTIPELIKIAAGIGTTLGDLTGQSPVRDRLVYAARTTNDAAAEAMKDRLAFYLEMDAHFEDLGYSATA
ncbi:hypothetical protein JCM18899A_00890 [Nocardioides sp. AN3]